MPVFDAISPLDYRYAVDKKYAKFFSENARITYQLRVEAALAEVLAEQGICSKNTASAIVAATEKITAESVYAEEQRIHHDIRALVNCIQKKVPEEARPYVHLGATSYDIIDTAHALRIKDGTEKVVLPALIALEKTLIALAEREENTLQIGRTHGQHAEPITLGLFFAGYASRLGKRIQEIRAKKSMLVGKFSGAVGAYNAASLLFPDPLAVEQKLMHHLGLKASESSTQIAEPEALADLAHALVSCFSVLAALADDCRHLQRTEINELIEAFEKEQVGSSTMPHKRNPVNFENVKSVYKAFMPRMVTVYLDQLSEHQRDLTNSASQRFLPELFVALTLSAERLDKTLKKTSVNKKALEQNFSLAAAHITAEPLYILLAMNGHPDAHETVRELSLEAEKTGKSILWLARQKKELGIFLKKFSKKHLELLEHPEQYTGLAMEKTTAICQKWKKEFA